MTARLFIFHHGFLNFERIKQATFIQEAIRLGLQDAGNKAFAQNTPLSVAAVRATAIANYWLTIPSFISNERNHACGHF